MRAYVLITTKPGTSEEVLRQIKTTREIKGVILADSVYGRFDAVVVIEAENLETITDIIYKVIEKYPNITHTETLLTLF
ncbi:MAG: Lrp/AsnC ligand binding domain-containing protein [Candidatus Bathyarchaeia archaeon]